MVEHCRAIPRPLAVATGMLLVLFLGLTDYITGAEISFSIFYLLPISFAALAAGRGAGYMVSVFAAIVWMVADIKSGASYAHPLIEPWNATVRLGYFALHTTLLTTLATTIERERRIARMDPLTNVANWRHFAEYANREIERGRRSRKPLTIGYIDLDNFKEVNDTLGHDGGDDLLCQVANLMQGQVRAGDMVARVGGDEFAVLLPETGYEDAAGILKRMHTQLSTEMKRSGLAVTFSVGAVTFHVLPSTVEALLKRADTLMYSVKQEGRNSLKHEEWPKPLSAE